MSDNKSFTSEDNSGVQKVISESIQQELKWKEETIKELFDCINEICKEHGIQYFAMGDLLTWCIKGQEDNIKNDLYCIGMLRKDYDIFMDIIKEAAKNDNIKVLSMYDYFGMIHSLHTFLFKRKTFKNGKSKVDMNIRLRVEPFDNLPNSKTERELFIREVAENTRAFRAFCRKTRDGWTGYGEGKVDKVRKLAARAFKSPESKKFRKDYKNLCLKYSQVCDANYAGRIEVVNYPAHKIQDITPIQTVPFVGTQLQIPAVTENFMALLMEEEREKFFQERVALLKKFDAICRKHDIEYVAMRSLAIFCSREEKNPEDLMDTDWYVGLRREEHDKLLSVLKSNESELALQETVDEFPAIRASVPSLLTDLNRKRFPDDNNAFLYLIPLDNLPDEYEKSMEVGQNIVEMMTHYKNLVAYEKGLTWECPPITAKNSWAYIDEYTDYIRANASKKADTEKLFTFIDDKFLTYRRANIYPVQDIEFYGFSLKCPQDKYYWHKKVDNEYIEVLAEQKTKVLGRFDAMCTKYEIPYFAISKLLMGAMIYNDIIPGSKDHFWDLGLLREDYQKVLKLLKEKSEEEGLAWRGSFDEDGLYPYKTVQISLIEDQYSNARIRILPFDKVPEDLYLNLGFIKDMDQKNKEYDSLQKQYNAATSLKEKQKALNVEYETLDENMSLKDAWNLIDAFAQSFNDDDRTNTYQRVAFEKSKSITYDELFPLQRVKFRNIEINCPKDTSTWQPYLDSELERQVTELQKADLYILQEFDKVCQKLNIGYFICGGTMLGYMRHGGFIPWDDDVDVAMLRADYDRFLAEAGPLLPDRFFLQTRQSDPNIPYLFSKIRLDDTEYLTKYNEKRDFHKGVCLDIFPFDFLPNNLPDRRRFVNEVKAMSREVHKVAREQYPRPELPVEARNELEAKYLQEQKEIVDTAWQQDLAEWQKKYLDIATRYNDKAKEMGLTVVGSFVPSYTWIDLKDLLPYQRGKFENIEVSVPKRPDVFLTMQYKNYMEWPPKHNQVAHRLLKWSTWDAEGGVNYKQESE